MLIYHTFQRKVVRACGAYNLFWRSLKRQLSHPFPSVPLARKAFPNTKKLKRASIKSFCLVSGTLTIWDTETLDFTVALIS